MKMKNSLFAIFVVVFAFANHATGQIELLKKADMQFKLKSFNSAIRTYETFIQSDPQNQSALIRLAEANDYLHNWEKAADWYKQAEEAPEFQSKHYLPYGKLLMRMGKYQEAKNKFVLYSYRDPSVGGHLSRACEYAIQRSGIEQRYVLKPLTSNTTDADYAPTFFGSQLVYVSGRKDIARPGDPNRDGGVTNDKNHLFITKLDPVGMPGTVRYFRTALRDGEENEGPLCFSSDGNKIAFIKNKFINGVSQTAFELFPSTLYMANSVGKGDWEEHSLFEHNGDYSISYPNLTPDGTTLYFASDMPGGKGGYDLYVSSFQEGKWSKPRNLGPTINTPGNEISPFVSGDELYFSSDYHYGFGGQDIFKAKFKSGDWEIESLGFGINSPANDFGFIFNSTKRVGYMVSDRKGNEDIFRVSEKAGGDITIVVLDAKTGSPIKSAVLDFGACSDQPYATDAAGRYSFQIVSDMNCNVSVSKDGYSKKALSISESDKSRGIIEVLLSKSSSNLYTAKVFDASGDLTPMPDVAVKATNQNDGTRLDLLTGADGTFYLPLQPRAKYIIKFSKAGYREIKIIVDTGDGTDKSIIKDIKLLRSDLPSEPPKPDVGEGPTTPVVDGDGGVAVDIDKIDVDSPSGSPVATPSSKGFSVQIMALSVKTSKLPDVSKLKSIGSVYYTADTKYKRFRVGVFKTKSEAKTALASLKTKGFPNAYIVEEKGENKIYKLEG